MKIRMIDRFSYKWHTFDFIENEYEIIASFLKDDNVVVDCGANIGVTSIFFSKCCPLGHIYSFEALPKNADAIEHNKKLNNANNITIVNKAIGSSLGTLTFTASGNGGLVSQLANKTNTINIPSISLDSYFCDKTSPSFIKIDVEGMELDVLKGSLNVLTDARSLAIELHIFAYEHKKEELKAIFDILSKKGFLHFLLQTDVRSKYLTPFELNDENINEISSTYTTIQLYCTK